MTFTQSKKFKVTIALTCMLFVFFFLLFFQPFGVNNYRADEKITWSLFIGTLSFSFSAFLGILFLEFVVRPKTLRSVKGKEYLAWLIFELFTISTLIHLVYNLLGNFHDFRWTSYLKHLVEISTILIFPMGATIFYFKHSRIVQQQHEMLKESSSKRRSNEVVRLIGDYKKSEIALPLKDLVAVTSEDNYVCLNYLQDDRLKKHLIRSTLTQFEKQLPLNYLARCSRSTLVNLRHLKSYTREGQRLTLKLNHFPQNFVVAKSQLKIFLALLKG